MQTLFIYGPPGSGKTTLGKLLAGRFGVPFEDLDDSIVLAAGGKSIPAIFADEGEAGFRARERAALERRPAPRRGAWSPLGEAPCWIPHAARSPSRTGRGFASTCRPTC